MQPSVQLLKISGVDIDEAPGGAEISCTVSLTYLQPEPEPPEVSSHSFSDV